MNGVTDYLDKFQCDDNTTNSTAAEPQAMKQKLQLLEDVPRVAASRLLSLEAMKQRL